MFIIGRLIFDLSGVFVGISVGINMPTVIPFLLE
jgi:hypothetical protein